MQSSKEVIKADLGYDSLHDKRMPYKKVTKWDVMNKVKELPCKTSTKDENMYRSLSLSIQKLLGIKQDRPLKMISGKRVIERLSLFSHKECIVFLHIDLKSNCIYFLIPINGNKGKKSNNNLFQKLQGYKESNAIALGSMLTFLSLFHNILSQ